MKTCGYCGREASEETGFCPECGTKFADPVATTAPPVPVYPAWFEWTRQALTYAGILFVVGALYLLSFGPVWRYCRTVTVGPAPVAAATVSGTGPMPTVTRVVRYPGWVGIVYQPAFRLRFATGNNGLYAQYLNWWDNLPDKN